jgi:uncharacterized protein (DUF2267 family)
MNRGQIVHELQRRGDFSSAEDAEAAVTATLSVLGERLAGGETKDLAAQLPPEFAEALPISGPGERFDLAEFYRRVAAREERDTDSNTAREHARAVMRVVLDAVSAGERSDVVAQLPADYRADLVS